MRRACLAVVLLSVACASAPIRKADQATLLTAHTRLLEGCYDCLVEARDTFRRLAVGRARPLLITSLFEAEVLVGLREREFAVDPSESFGRATALLAELPPEYPGARYLELSRLVPPDDAGATWAERTAFERASPRVVQLRELQKELLAGAGSAPFRAYLSASLDCVVTARRATTGLREAPADAPMLVRYRMWTCPAVRGRPLETIAAAVPDFIEAEFLVARQPSLNITSAYTKRQREAFTAAALRFPRSPAIAYGLGALNQTVGDCKAAILHYEDTIALSPEHEDAAMQRVICLGHIGQFVPAIEGATRIIERRYYNMSDAYYWRAWSHYQRRDLTAARADIDDARAVSFNIKVLTLGGMIKYDQRHLDLAEADLSEAVKMDIHNAQCVARWYYGLVSFARELWPDTAERFAVAATCYRNAAERSRQDLAAMKVADVDEVFRANQIAGFEAVIKEDTDQEHASYLNTANCWARAGDLVKAREWLARIPADSLHAGTAAQLRKEIGGS
jgi:tetratricopeptide (TPR) repeat protein